MLRTRNVLPRLDRTWTNYINDQSIDWLFNCLKTNYKHIQLINQEKKKAVEVMRIYQTGEEKS